VPAASAAAAAAADAADDAADAAAAAAEAAADADCCRFWHLIQSSVAAGHCVQWQPEPLHHL
jgi:hypothetical protein